jgi:hypothetical protein
MKHVQTQPKKAKSENLLIVFVLLIGLAGLLMAFRGQSGNQEPEFTPFTSQSAQLSKADIIQVEGELQAGTPIQFRLGESLDPGNWVIDFGNGVAKTLRTDTFSYVYDEAASYQIQLRDQQGRVLATRQLHIGSDQLAFANG